MKKYFVFYIMAMSIAFISCGQNPMKVDVMSKNDFEILRAEALKDAVTITTPGAKPVFMRFYEDSVTGENKVDINVTPNSPNWHLTSADATWRMSSNSGTTAENFGTGGNGRGGVKVYKGVAFDDIKSINHTGGLVGDWREDQELETSMGLQSVNYYLNRGANNPATANAKNPSETYLFNLRIEFMGPGGVLYEAGYNYIFIVKDGAGDNYMKIQPIEISTDGVDMTFDNRVYMFKFEIADASGNFN